MRPINRRTFLATSGVVLLAACGSSGAANTGSDNSSDSSGAASTDDAGGTNPAELAGAFLAPRWNNYVLVPGAVRLPTSFRQGDTVLSDGPAKVTGRVLDLDDNVVVDGLVAEKHNAGIPSPYWLFTVQLDTPGLYRLVVDGAAPEGQALQINDPSAITIPKVGEALPPFDTPTVDDGRGVDPICTAEPACPYHGVTLTEALAAGKPVAYLIGTPAYCQTGFCGPILELLQNVSDRYGDAVTVVHAEVYTDRSIATPAPAIGAYRLDFEPVLYVADATGTIVQRLDAAFDEAEMDDAFASVV